MDIRYLKEFLSTKGFRLENGSSDIWSKKYNNIKDYKISVHLKDTASSSAIDWGVAMMQNISDGGRKTTCNFKDQETLVVVDCVDRLLTRGYKPENITLEKDWKLGHKGKGFLDILVTDLDGNSYLMIECKTWGREYEKEKISVLKNGGQLFSYFIQEKTTQYLCLYTATFDGKNAEYKGDIIVVTEAIRSAQNQQEGFEKWNPQVFETKGIFEESELPYKVKFEGIKKRDLRPLTREDGGDIFNRFAEILRKNVVSDKSNAFNKIFNLFLCKIVDEDKRGPEDLIKFQWNNTESNEDVMLRLNDLYKEGMDLYLQLKISAVSEEEITQSLNGVNTEEGKTKLRELFIKQKLYSSNEFAFKEVFDKESFDENCIVVKEVVKLLERYQIKYAQKQQFLGDFFEKLLNSGIKQEAGQFFTPIPLAAFISKSLPIKEIIDLKNNKSEINILPYSIDYASGSGHFLTEIMAEIDIYVRKITQDLSYVKGGSRAKSFIESQKDNYLWAKEYIYGIEKDYRLAKTTKISTFLNGDGDANVICGDGLDSFLLSKEYKGKLKVSSDGMNNEQFDILVANPPYSVSGFKMTLKNGKGSFDLFKDVTDQSSEIECLFIERAKQLLKEGGVAGIILPVSILSNGKIYTKTRGLILRNFEIKGILQLGSNAFMATGTKTVVMFLKKRAPNYYSDVQSLVNKFFVDNKDFNWNGKESIISEYVKYIFGDKIETRDYLSLLNKEFTPKIEKTDLLQDYFSKFKDYRKETDSIKQNEDKKIFFSNLIANEKEKISYFLLTQNQNVVIVKSGEKQKEKDFLGYEFSNRRGAEGIRIYKNSALYNSENLADTTKVNSYILRNYNDEPIMDIDPNLKDYLQVRTLHELLDFDRVDFEKVITLVFKKKPKFESRFKVEKLSTLIANGDIQFVQGVVFDKDAQVQEKTDSRVLTASNIDLTTRTVDLSEELYLRDGFKLSPDKVLKKNDIFLCTSSGSLSHLGKSAFIKEDLDIYFGGFCAVIRCKDVRFAKYLFSLLDSDEYRNFINQIVGQNINNLNSKILNFAVPYPDQETLKSIVATIEKNEKESSVVIDKIENAKDKISDLIENTIGKSQAKDRLGSLCLDIVSGGTPSTTVSEYWQGDIPWVTLVDTKTKYLLNTQRKITQEGLSNSNATMVPVNTVLFSSRATIGDVSIAKVPLTTNQGYKNLICDPKKVNYEFLYYVMKREAKNIKEVAEKMTYPEINKTQLSDYRVPIVPLPEQEKFVDKILDLEKQLEVFKKEIEEKRQKDKVNLRKYL